MTDLCFALYALFATQGRLVPLLLRFHSLTIRRFSLDPRTASIMACSSTKAALIWRSIGYRTRRSACLVRKLPRSRGDGFHHGDHPIPGS